MFNDVDDSLQRLLAADVPVDSAEVDISFERPTREWASRLTGPTINLFLFDIRERTDFRDDSWRVSGRSAGAVTQTRPPRRVDLCYMVTAWAREPADEHRILGRLLASLMRNQKVPTEHLSGSLVEATLPVLLRVTDPDHLLKPADFWGVMDNELRTSLTWVVTAPLDVFVPQTGPMVVSRELVVSPLPGEEDFRTLLVGGFLRTAGTGEPMVAATIRLDGHAPVAHTGPDGRYRLAAVPRGKHKVFVETADGRKVELSMTVPSDSYDLEIDPAKKVG